MKGIVFELPLIDEPERNDGEFQGLASGTGGYFITQAYRSSEAALIAPFEYLALVLAIFWGITIFGEFPDVWAWTGIALILGSGLFVLWRESVLNKRLASERPMPRNR